MGAWSSFNRDHYWELEMK